MKNISLIAGVLLFSFFTHAVPSISQAHVPGVDLPQVPPVIVSTNDGMYDNNSRYGREERPIRKERNQRRQPKKKPDGKYPRVGRVCAIDGTSVASGTAGLYSKLPVKDDSPYSIIDNGSLVEIVEYTNVYYKGEAHEGIAFRLLKNKVPTCEYRNCDLFPTPGQVYFQYAQLFKCW